MKYSDQLFDIHFIYKKKVIACKSMNGVPRELEYIKFSKYSYQIKAIVWDFETEDTLNNKTYVNIELTNKRAHK